jgi:Ca-activated chloride channel family protein
MTVNQPEFFPGVLAVFVLFLGIVLYQERRFFRFVKTYWFYRRSLLSYLASILFLTGFGGLLLGLLDFRGPEEKVKTEVPRERTIILIDTSASMLAEDVKPSRLQKAALIAKHFARKAAGHQLSVVAFAEGQKKIVPFTNDLDLIDARLDSIENLRNQYGSSALTVAIQESVQYFREADGEARGNILVLTDGEETAEGIDLKVPKAVNVALVGVGTTQGGRIPLDDGRGFRFGYKKERGRDVITKLNESFFKQVAGDLPAGKYWPANSYALPSEEILDFFRGERRKGADQQDMVVKPVMMEWVVLPALGLVILSYVLKSVRIFTLSLLLVAGPIRAQEAEAPKLTPELVERLDQLQKGALNRLEKLKLADDLQRAGARDESLSLYQENLPAKVDPALPPEAYLNYGTSLLQKGDAAAGLGVYDQLARSLGDSAKGRKLKDMMDKNVVSFFAQQEQKKKERQKKQEKKDSQENKDPLSESQPQNGNQDDPQQGKSGQQQKPSKNKDPGQPKPEDQKKKEGSEPESGDEKPEKKKDDPADPKDGQEKIGEPKQLPPQKLPAKLKQLMSDDRQLQMKMIENGTRDLNRRKSRKSKDW